MDYDTPGEYQGRILGGDLESMTLQSVLKMLALGSRTGVLIVQNGSDQLKIALQDGAISSLEEPSATEPDLLDLLKAMGRLGPEQMMLIPQDARRDLASVILYLVNTGLMSPAEELQRREFVVTQALSRAVHWDRGHFEFRNDSSSARRTGGMYTPSAAQPLNVDHVVLEALRLADEREHMRVRPASRATRARKAYPNGDDPRLASLSAEESWVYRLCDERRTLYAIAYALLMPEAVAGAWLATLLERGLVVVVDERLDQELERDLVTLLTNANAQFEKLERNRPERLMHDMALVMGGCVNALLAHHAQFARALRAQGDTTPQQALRVVDHLARPLVERAQMNYPRMDEIIRVERGRMIFDDINTLDRVVRGAELIHCYWDAARMIHAIMRDVYDAVCAEELGAARGARKFDDLWLAFLRGLDYEMGRLHQWYSATFQAS